MPGGGMGGDLDFGNVLGSIFPAQRRHKKVTVEKAYKMLIGEECDKLIDNESVNSEAIRRAEQEGVVFIDETPKKLFSIAEDKTVCFSPGNLQFNATKGSHLRADGTIAKGTCRSLKITIPKELDYNELFDDLFEKYTTKATLVKVKLKNLGTLFQLTYDIVLKDVSQEKAFIDEVRIRNANLDILCSRVITNSDEL